MTTYALPGAALECLQRLAALPRNDDVDFAYRDDALELLVTFALSAQAAAKQKQRAECEEVCRQVASQYSALSDAAESHERMSALDSQACAAFDCIDAMRDGFDSWRKENFPTDD